MSIAETGITGVTENGEPILEQFPHARRIAQRRAGAELETMHRAVDTKQRHLKQTPALAPPIQHSDQLARQLLDRAQYIGFARDGIGETPFGHGRWQRQARRDGFFDTTQRLIETKQQLLAEARGERRPRARYQIGNAGQTGCLQDRNSLSIDPQRRDRQTPHRGLGLTGRYDALLAIARDAPRTTGGVGHRDAGAQSLLREPADQVAGERRLAAEQVRATGDVEQQAIRRIETDQRRVAITPVGDAFEKTLIRFRIGFHHWQLGIHGAGIGEAHAGFQSEPDCAVGQRGDPLGGLHRCDNDESFNRFGRAALDPIGR